MKARLVILSLFLLASCQPAPQALQFTLNGEAYSVGQAVNDTIDLVTLSTEFEAQICVADAGRYGNITVNDIPLQDGAACIPVDRIARDECLTLCWGSGAEQDTVYLRTLHAGIPRTVTTGMATSPGDFYLSFVNVRLIEKVDNAGNILFFRFEPVPVEAVDMTKSPGWWDFKKHVVDGAVYYSYHAPDPKAADLGFMGYNPGMRIVLDAQYQPVDTLQLLPSRDGFVKAGDPIDGHDFCFFAPDHYILSSYIERDGVYAAYLQEVQGGEVVFDWWSTGHPEMAGWLDPAFADAAGKDYVHFNAIDILPDGNWLCSFRHVSSLVKIDRANGTGDLLWRITCSHGQHFARWHENDQTITLFNNGNGTGHTQMLRVKVDEKTGKTGAATVLRDDGYYSQACGALTFSGENMIVGWGIPGPESPCDRIVAEYDATGAEVFGIRHASSNDKLNQYLSSYRCVKCE